MRPFFLLLLSLFSLVSCSKKEGREKETDKETNKVYVLATTAMISDLVRNVGGDHVYVETLIKNEMDPHTYELVKGDDEKFADADIIFYNGLGLEHGFSLRHNLESNNKAVALGDIILHSHPERIHKIGHEYDPHIWMDISLWALCLDTIAEVLADFDKQHKEEFIAQAQEQKRRMLATDNAMYAELQKIPPERRFLVTSHNAFYYFVRRYFSEPAEIEKNNWAQRLEAPEGLSPLSELSLTDIQRVLDYAVAHGIEVCFPESNLNHDALRKVVKVAKEKGINLRLSEYPLYGDSMGKLDSYLKMIEHNVHILTSELNARE